MGPLVKTIDEAAAPLLKDGGKGLIGLFSSLLSGLTGGKGSHDSGSIDSASSVSGSSDSGSSDSGSSDSGSSDSGSSDSGSSHTETETVVKTETEEVDGGKTTE
jgi:hypothetical protein